MAIRYQDGAGPEVQAPRKVPQEPEKQKKKSTGRKKKAVIAVGAVAAVAAVAAGIGFGVKTLNDNKVVENGFLTPEEAAAEFAELSYSGKGNDLFHMFPAEMQEAIIVDVSRTFDLAEDPEKRTKSVERRVEILNGNYGEMSQRYGYGNDEVWSAKHAVSDEVYIYTDEEMEELRRGYILMEVEGLQPEEARIMTVETEVESPYTGAEKIVYPVPVVRDGDKWFLGLQGNEGWNTYTADKYQYWNIWERFLEPLHIVGEFDENMNRIYRTDEGFQVNTREDGFKYYEDSFGNIHEVKGEDGGPYEEISVTGPDGGEVLDESNYEEYWTEYYDKMAAEAEGSGEGHVHEDADASVSGNLLPEGAAD